MIRTHLTTLNAPQTGLCYTLSLTCTFSVPLIRVIAALQPLMWTHVTLVSKIRSCFILVSLSGTQIWVRQRLLITASVFFIVSGIRRFLLRPSRHQLFIFVQFLSLVSEAERVAETSLVVSDGGHPGLQSDVTCVELVFQMASIRSGTL